MEIKGEDDINLVLNSRDKVLFSREGGFIPEIWNRRHHRRLCVSGKPFTLKRRDEAKKDIVSGSESGLDCNAIDHVKGNHFSTYHQPNFSNFVDRSCL